MDREKLQQILEFRNARAINREIVKEGFFNIAKHPILKKVNLVPIAQSKNLISLDWIDDYKYSFQANYVELVEQYPEYEFIWLQINKYYKKFNIFVPHILRVYAKDKKEK